MFTISKTGKHQDAADWNGFLERGVRMEGHFESPGTLHLNCHFKGQLRGERGIILGKESQVEGEVWAREVVVGGRLEGTVTAIKCVEILPGAVVKGEIHSPCVVIAAGAIFDGNCQVTIPQSRGIAPVIAVRSGARA